MNDATRTKKCVIPVFKSPSSYQVYRISPASTNRRISSTATHHQLNPENDRYCATARPKNHSSGWNRYITGRPTFTCWGNSGA
jgi:hypothetical protein